MDRDEKFDKLIEMIQNSKYLVAFTGAGISTASGIPDYRGPNGIWTLKERGITPPKPNKRWSEFPPNQAHLSLKRLLDSGKVSFLISQNVDGLHLKSGIKEHQIAELHGNSTIMRCLYCESKYDRSEIGWSSVYGKGREDEPIHPDQPFCINCGGRIVSTIVDFGDPLPKKELERAKTESIQSDLFMVLGSSLSVSPAASFPKIAKKHGAKVIIINQGKTKRDEIADLKIDADLSILLPKIEQKLQRANY